LRGNKLRSFLTVFGVVIGIITVMLIASIISGIDVSVKREVESFGTRSIYISKYNPGHSHRPHVARRANAQRVDLRRRDRVARCRRLSCQFPSSTSPTTFWRKLMVSGGGKTSAQVALQGTLPEFEKAGTQVISEGRFFTQTETIRTRKLCVSVRKSPTTSFKFGSPVGQTIKIGAAGVSRCRRAAETRTVSDRRRQ
jgi:putative ABC transport system permease protein